MPPTSVLTSLFSIHYSPLPLGPLLCLPRSYPHCLRSHDPSSLPRSDESYFVGYLLRYFVRYSAGNDHSCLLSSLPSNKDRYLLSSTLSSCLHRCRSCFPSYSADCLVDNLPSHLASSEVSSWLRDNPIQDPSAIPSLGFRPMESGRLGHDPKGRAFRSCPGRTLGTQSEMSDISVMSRASRDLFGH